MLLLPHHSSAAQRRPTNKPLCKQMSHDMFVCCAESSRQVLQSFVLILLWFYQTLIISLGNMWPQLGLHLRHQRSRLFCVVASIWGIWLHWTLFFTSCKRILPTHSVCMRDRQKLAVHLMLSFLFCCLHMNDLDKLDTYWCLGLRSQLASCTGRHMKSPFDIYTDMSELQILYVTVIFVKGHPDMKQLMAYL